MQFISDSRVNSIFNQYPTAAKEQLLKLKALVINAAEEIEGLEKLEETLKWGEPSYLTKNGSTIRMDWKKKNPEQVAIYFKCTSKLVETFRNVYPNNFKFEGNRAIVFSLQEKIPQKELKHCISMALNYHKIKHLHLLGS